MSLLLLLSAAVAVAQPVDKRESVARGQKLKRGISEGTKTRINWTCPTTRINGDAFDCATDAEKFQIEIVAGQNSTTVDVGPDVRTRSIVGDVRGTRYRVRVCDMDGLCSAWAGPVYNP